MHLLKPVDLAYLCFGDAVICAAGGNFLVVGANNDARIQPKAKLWQSIRGLSACRRQGDMQGPCNKEEVSIKGLREYQHPRYCQWPKRRRQDNRSAELRSWRTRNLELICDRQLEGN